jgi:hypothetical protein
MKNLVLSVLTFTLITTAFATGRSEAPIAATRDCVECKLQAELNWAHSIDQLMAAGGNHRLAVKDDNYLMLRSPR